MEIYLLEDQPFEFHFGKQIITAGCCKSVTGIANFFLREENLSPTGKGVVSNCRFPWIGGFLEKGSAAEFGFPFCVKFIAIQLSFLASKTFKIHAEGAFAEAFKYAHGITEIVGCLKLKLDATLSSGNYTIAIRDSMIVTTSGITTDGSESPLDENSILQIFNSAGSRTTGKMTIRLMMENTKVPIEYELTNAVEALKLNERILQGKIKSDLVLIADNDTKFSCHQSFLSAHSAYFERMFETDWKETKTGNVKLSLSEEGLEAFLDYVYCLRTATPTERPSIAVELLEFAHEKQIFGLEEAMKDLILAKPDDWMNLDGGLQLFLHSMKLEAQGYADVKKKAVKVIKTNIGELTESAIYEEMLKTNLDSVTELLRSCCQS